MFSYEFFVAMRHIKSRRGSFLSTISLIAIVGVFLGVTALTSVIAVTGGFQEAFRDRVLGINSHILVLKYGIDFRDYRETQELIDGVDGVIATSPFIFHEMIATHDRKTAGILIKGIEPLEVARVSDIPKYADHDNVLEELVYDRFPKDGVKESPRVLIGRTLADKLGAERGDKIQITSPLESLDPDRWSAKGHNPSSNHFIVAGVYDSGFHEYDSRLVMTDYRALQDFFNQGDMVTGIDIRVKDVFAVHLITKDIESVIPAGRFRVLDWRELNHNLFTSLGLQRLVLGVLFFFIVVVASFNIVGTLIMIVLDKQKEIAILKSMGASRRDILWIFVIEGFVIGAIGTVNGLIGGLLVCLAIMHTDFGLDPTIYMIDYLPVRIIPTEFLGVGAAALAVSLLATVGPAWWASKWRPVDGLRHD